MSGPRTETEVERQQRDGDFGLLLCEHIWRQCGDLLRLAGEDYEVLGDEEVPGYEDDDCAVLLRRTSDGKIFEAEIDVSINPIRETAQVTR